MPAPDQRPGPRGPARREMLAKQDQLTAQARQQHAGVRKHVRDRGQRLSVLVNRLGEVANRVEQGNAAVDRHPAEKAVAWGTSTRPGRLVAGRE